MAMKVADAGSSGSGPARYFPTLGFDPAPGNPGSVRALLLELTSGLTQLGTTMERLESAIKITDDADWGGSAAEEFSDHADDLPRGIAAGAKAMGNATEALSTWAGKLVANQSKADELERKAKRLKEQLAAAQNDLQGAVDSVDPQTSHPEIDPEVAGAQNKVDHLSSALQKVISDAERLQRKHEREAGEAAEAIRDHGEGAFEVENDGAWVQAFDITAEVSGWVAAGTGAAAALAAMTVVGAPVAGVLGGVSAASTGLHTVASIGQQTFDSGNAPGWRSIAIDLGSAGILKGGKLAWRALKSGEDLTGAARKQVTEAVEKYQDDLRDASRIDLKDGWAQGLNKAQDNAGPYADLVGNAKDLAEQAGIELTPQQKRELYLLQLGLDPTDPRALETATNMTKDYLKNAD